MDDRPFCRDACFKHANVHSKAVFSNAMTIMDEVYEWEDEEKRVGSKLAACMWIYTKRGADKMTNTHSGNGGLQKETNDVLCAMHELGLCWYFR